MKALKIVFVLFLLSILALTSGSTDRLLQITTRSQSVGKLCANFPDRYNIVDDKTKADSQLNKAAMQASFKKSGNQLFVSVLNSPNGALNAAVVQLPSLGTELGLFAGPFLLGLIIILFIWPFLCCCCCCPSCCPSKCCQKSDEEQYTKCELLWPAVVLILAILLMIIASVIGITRSSDIEQSYKAVACSLAITFDDIANGNVSSTGKFFIGMNGLYNTLTQLDTGLTTVNTQMQKLRISSGQELADAYNEGTATLTEISKIPTGGSTANAVMPSFSYTDNFDGSTTGPSSTFPTLLGSITGGAGAVYTAHYAFNLINEGLKSISDLADSFDSQFSGLSGNIGQFKTSMQSMVDQVNGFDSMISNMDSVISQIMTIVTLAVTAVFGVFIGLGVLSIIGTLFMTCCDKYSCRYLVYFVCVILFVLGIFCFLLSTLFSILTPIIYFGCDFLTVSISSPANFSSNLGNTLGGQLSSYLQVCLPGGTGDIINQMQGVDLSGVTAISDAIAQVRAFDTTAIQTASYQTLTTLSDFIDRYYYTDQYDFSSSNNQNFIADVATPTNIPGCTINGFQADKWVPSIRNSAFSCSGTSKTAEYSATANTQCSDNTRLEGGYTNDNSANGCYGCMDSTKILVKITPSPSFTNRYNNAGCNLWITKMNSLQTNFYNYKKTKYGPVQTQMQSTITRFNTATTGYNARLTAVGTAFTTIIGALEGSLTAVFDPQYGLMSGLNCLLLGQDLNLVINTTCAKLFNTLFFLRLALGLSAFGILFSLCCGTCSGVRAFKHMNKKNIIVPDLSGGLGHQNSMNALNTKY